MMAIYKTKVDLNIDLNSVFYNNFIINNKLALLLFIFVKFRGYNIDIWT